MMTNEIQLDLFSAESSVAPSPIEVANQMGDAHQVRLAVEGTRKGSGSFYTPPWVVDGLLTITLAPILRRRCESGPEAVAAVRILDPACGSGNFLAAAGQMVADALTGLGVPRAEARAQAFGTCVVGVDIDADAVAICRRALIEAGGRNPHVWAGDALLMAETQSAVLLDTDSSQLSWPQLVAQVGCEGGGFDLVVGNPPFLSQLGSDTARASAYHADLKRRFGDAVGGYADPAVLFLLLATRLARPDRGIATLIQPQSVLATRDAGTARAAIAAIARIAGIWIATDRVFDAAVDVCAPILERNAADTPVMLYDGPTFAELDALPEQPDPRSWAGLLASAKGLPSVSITTSGRLGDIADATADFRDQYYGLAPHVVDEPSSDLPALITSGAIDPAHVLWGKRPTKFNKVTYQFPRVRVDDLDESLQPWAQRRLVPKVLVATQTKVLESIVDAAGSLLPSVPVITVTAPDHLLDRIAALLTSPPVTLIAAQRHLGAALSSDALKLSAREVLQLPLPVNEVAWAKAAASFRLATDSTNSQDRRSHLLDAARSMCAAFEVDDAPALIDWWIDRLPKGRDAP